MNALLKCQLRHDNAEPDDDSSYQEAATRWIESNAEQLVLGSDVLFLRRHGAWAVFFSRFLSPLRATVPLVTGASGTSLWQFQLANVSSGLLWPLVLLAPGALSLNF